MTASPTTSNLQPMPPPRPIPDWAAAEFNALEWTRWLGFTGAQLTSPGADRGLDIEGGGAFVQVKFHGKAIAPNLVQQLFGARGRREGQMLFFSNSGYTRAALECADDLGIICFQYSPSDGQITPSNRHAREIVTAAGSSQSAMAAVSRSHAKRSNKSTLIDGNFAQFSPDGSMIAYRCSPKRVRVETFPGRVKVAKLKTGHYFHGLQFVDQSLLAIHSLSLNETAIWDIRSAAVVRTIGQRRKKDVYSPYLTYVRKVECHGQVLMTREEEASRDRLVLWSTDTGEQEDVYVFPKAKEEPVSWSISPKERVLVACIYRENGRSRSWHLRIGEQSHQTALGDGYGVVFRHFTFTPDGIVMAAAGSAPQIELWDVGQRRRFTILQPAGLEDEDSVTAVAISADSSLLAAGASDRTIRVWDLASHQEVLILEGHEEEVHEINFSPDGHHLLTSDEGGSARLWNIAEVV